MRKIHQVGYRKFLVENTKTAAIALWQPRWLPKGHARRFVIPRASRGMVLLIWSVGAMGGVLLGVLFDHYFLKFWK